MTETVLVVGGYGVFGGLLARRLIRDGDVDVLVAGRSLEKARRFCAIHGGRPVALDARAAGLSARLAALSPSIVVDAGGPFQARRDVPCRLAEAALEGGAHYLDLSDDAGFTAGIGRLDDLARSRGLVALSGVSTVPAISSAACDELCAGMARVHLIETALLPGNRAPRGPAVMASILAQVGRPMSVWRGGRWTRERGWSLGRKEALSVGGSAAPVDRLASLIGATDLMLFPARYRADSVLFRAGLELGLMHRGLAVLGAINRFGLLPPASLTASLMKPFADALERFGSDRGGMIVRVIGENAEGQLQQAAWTLVAEDGDGPEIAAVPAYVVIGKLRRGAVAPGARACVSELDLAELDAGLAPLRTSSSLSRSRFVPLFEEILGDDWARLPPELRSLHGLADTRAWIGEASITRCSGLLSRLAGWLAGFPPASKSTTVEVVMRRTPGGETWQRRFGTRQFRSYLSAGASAAGAPRPVLRERFGAMVFDIALSVAEGRLHYPVRSGRIFGLPLPAPLRPISETSEFVDADGRIRFDVSVRLPLAGPVVRYQGWLREREPDEPSA